MLSDLNGEIGWSIESGWGFEAEGGQQARRGGVEDELNHSFWSETHRDGGVRGKRFVDNGLLMATLTWTDRRTEGAG